MTNRAADRDAREPHERMRALNQRQRKSNSAIHFQTLKLNRKVKILRETFEPNVLGNTIFKDGLVFDWVFLPAELPGLGLLVR